ncbi:DUF4942 domain-containing protein, partial [Thiocystis minor]|uniref:DUF4942 domain-containing protein n=1 Tax=Thiocystis minor TaxID=61597 RepID=UPI0030B87BC2
RGYPFQEIVAMIDQQQFYPTPAALARKAWSKFQNREFTRVLEPSAGTGDLAGEMPWSRHDADKPIDCIEMDLAKHARLREQGFRVVGMDFLQFSGGAFYSHVVMNPPFARGTEHVLKAWDILWDGEIVAILNAETLRNPYTKERQRLARLVNEHGGVEYINDAFSTSETERKTDVEIALVYLRKQVRREDIVGSLLDDLTRDATSGEALAGDDWQAQELCLPGSEIDNAVLRFKAAVQAMRESVLGEARASHYASRLGHTLAVSRGDASEDTHPREVKWVTETLHERYLTLKDRAWNAILSSTKVSERLSRAVRNDVERQFEDVKQLEFSAANVYAFLLGLSENQGQIQMDMLCEVFDEITRYHTDNRVFYKGWKSNDKHRTAGIRIKTSRFVLPHHGTESHAHSMKWDSMNLLADFDRAFAMLDGKRSPEVGLCDVFRTQFRALRDGARVSSRYFDVRYYPKVGTIHFFARDKKLVERLNLLVGRQRRWLPPEDVRVSDAFWLQYEKAEAFEKDVNVQITALAKSQGSGWEDPRRRLNDTEASVAQRAQAIIDQALDAVLEKQGIDVQGLLDTTTDALQLELLVA